MIRRLLCVAALCLAPVLALADARLTQLIDLLELDAYVEITREEGLRDVPELTEDFLGHPPDTVLLDQMRRVYDAERMRETVHLGMAGQLTETETEAALLFIGSEMGQKIVALELAARRAMSDSAIEEAAKEAWARAPEEKPWLVARIRELIEASDLVERNVVGALNSNFRFMQGLAEGGGTDIPQSDLLAEIWTQEEAIREDTAEWLGAYLLLAYQPLEAKEIETLIRFWQTETGGALNAAMFEAFNQLYDGLSYATARVLSLRVGSEEL